MLTPTTWVAAPGLIEPRRSAWLGSLADAFAVDPLMWDRLDELLALHAPTGEDEDEERSLAEALRALHAVGLDDQALAELLFDDPNLTIIRKDL